MEKVAKRIGPPVNNESLNTERYVLLQRYKFEPPLYGINEGYLVTDFDMGYSRLGGFNYPEGLDTRFGKIAFIPNGPRQLPTTDHKVYLEEYDYIIK